MLPATKNLRGHFTYRDRGTGIPIHEIRKAHALPQAFRLSLVYLKITSFRSRESAYANSYMSIFLINQIIIYFYCRQI